MNVALVGYGRMNRAIEAIAVARGHAVSLRVTSTNALASTSFQGIDVAMEFSTAGICDREFDDPRGAASSDCRRHDRISGGIARAH